MIYHSLIVKDNIDKISDCLNQYYNLERDTLFWEDMFEDYNYELICKGFDSDADRLWMGCNDDKSEMEIAFVTDFQQFYDLIFFLEDKFHVTVEWLIDDDDQWITNDMDKSLMVDDYVIVDLEYGDAEGISVDDTQELIAYLYEEFVNSKMLTKEDIENHDFSEPLEDEWYMVYKVKRITTEELKKILTEEE